MVITFTPLHNLPEQFTSQITQVFIFEKMLVKMRSRISSTVKKKTGYQFPLVSKTRLAKESIYVKLPFKAETILKKKTKF